MAFSNNPQYSTYKQETIKFDGAPLFRAGDLSVNRDLQIVNMYYDRISQENKTRETRLRKRAGLTDSTYSLSKVSSTDAIRGSFYDVDQNSFYWVVGTKCYSVKPDSGTSVRTVATINTASGYVGFCSFLKSDDTRYVIFSDGTDLWVDNYAGSSCSRVTDGDMPTPHQPYPIYLDGYVFLVESSSGNIWNSVVDDPTSWTAGSFKQAEISSDYSIRLIKAQNYLVCLGANSIEYFWDAANAAPDSPLDRNDSPMRSVGYITGLCTISDTTYFVGQDANKNIGVYSINSFKVERISNPVVDRTIQSYSSAINTKGQVNLAKDGFAISVDGHTFYCLVTTQTTWVYDVDDKFWYEWKGSDGAKLNIEAVWGMYNGSCYVAIANRDYISVLSPSIYQDFSSNFTCRYVTEPVDIETANWKTCHRLFLHCSQHTNTGTSNLSLSWTDNDWASSSAVRNINIFSQSPMANRLGKFRTRSWKFEYADNYPFWMTDATIDLNVGKH